MEKEIKKFIPQVPREHYFTPTYDKLARWISYWHQIDLVGNLEGKNILEIGVGNKTVSDYLKKIGFKVTTCDFARDLKPDVIADIRKLPFKDDDFDIVMACEVLEHIPIEDVINKALPELYRVSKRYVVISIPYYTNFFAFWFKIGHWYLKPWQGILRIERWWHLCKKGKEHYWTMGVQNYSLKRIKKLFSRAGFKIKTEVSPVLNPYHYFFVLEK